jgi:hypothetical protein
MRKKDIRKVWYVEFPLYQYNEDVKEIARKNDLKIVDARFKGDNKQVANATELTKKKGK